MSETTVYIVNLINSDRVVSDLLAIAQKVVSWLIDPSQESVYDNMSVAELVEMFARREPILKEQGKNYGGYF